MNLLWMLAADSDKKLDASNASSEITSLFWSEVWPWIEIVLWILAAVLAIVFIVKGVLTAIAVMKAADEPQVRQEKISAFKYLAIGLGVAIVVLVSVATIIPLILKQADVGDIDTAAFLLK